MSEKEPRLRVLVVEEQPLDAERVALELKRAGFELVGQRAQRMEEVVVDAMRAGAVDFLPKNRLARLPRAVTQALEYRRIAGERSRAEAALREQRAELHSLVGSAPDAIVRVDARGRVTRWNAAAERIFAVSRDAAVGMEASRFLSLAEGGGGVGRRGDGSEFPIEATVSPADETGKRTLVVRDDTARQDAAAERATMQVVMNLASNAIEACGQGPGTVEVSVQSRIFHPFFTTKPRGKGLGLSALLGTVNRLGAALYVESRPGAGSRFTVLMRAAVEVASSAAAEPEEPSGFAGTILVADDEPLVLAAVKRVLEGRGHRVLTVGSGREAIERLRERPDAIDLAIVDLSMSDLSGDEVLPKLRALRPDLPALLASGWTDEKSEERFRSQGWSGLIAKPFSSRVLVECVQRALRAGRTPPRSQP